MSSEDFRKCPDCGHFLYYLVTSGWYCQNCLYAEDPVFAASRRDWVEEKKRRSKDGFDMERLQGLTNQGVY
jgi:hypothetical protein